MLVLNSIIGNIMNSKINVRDILVKNINCGNIILYLDQLWKVTAIKHSLKNSYIHFHAERQPNETEHTSSTHLNKDILRLKRFSEAPITIID